MRANRRKLCLSCGVALSSGLAGCSGIFDQSVDPDSDGSRDESTSTDQATTNSDQDTGSEDDTETDNDGQSDSLNGDSFDVNTETGEFVLDLFELPDNFEFHDEELLIVPELTEDDPEREELEEKKIVRQHRREFVEDAELDEASFVTSTVYICEGENSAEEIRQNQRDAFTSNEDVIKTTEEEFEIATTVIQTESDDGDDVYVFIGIIKNAVFELLATGELVGISARDLYTKML